MDKEENVININDIISIALLFAQPMLSNKNMLIYVLGALILTN